MTRVAATVRTPTGPAFTVVLIGHVAVVLIGLVTLVAGGLSAARLLLANGRELPPSVRSYFSPGVNWAGRVLYLVPVFGAALLAMSHGADRVGDAWVLEGIGLWAGAVTLAEGFLWPAERRVQRALEAGDGAGAGSDVRKACRQICAAAAGASALVVAAMVVMVARP
jgi:hypothetical protein